MTKFRYSVNLMRSAEDDAYVATAAELPGLSAVGATAETAVAEFVEAAGAYLDALLDDGMDLPAPLESGSFSGQFRVRVPVSLHEALSARARYEGVSLNTLVVCLLGEGLGLRSVRSFTRSGAAG